jgi:predicted TIM-barrel fold metal-dependent hydrolase
LNTKGGDPAFADTLAVAQAWALVAPGRLVWGSDWPHATEQAHPPDTLALRDLLAAWVPDAQLRQRILVDNPAALYGFAPVRP